MTVKWHGVALEKLVEKAALDGAEEWLRADVQTDAKEHCPVDSGAMRNSHTVERSGDSAVIGVGGSSAPYAQRQHEDASLSHEVGESHWLENAGKRQISRLPSKLKKHIGGAL